MDQKIIVGTVCFIRDAAQNKVLLLLRNRAPMVSLYTGVGGKTNFEEDVRVSCLREIKEETGLTVEGLQLCGVLKTVLKDGQSSWILYVYTAFASARPAPLCDEGQLIWVPFEQVLQHNLIGFIRRIWPYLFEVERFFEGFILHDSQGNVLEESIHCY